MNKLITKVIGVALGLTMAIGVGVAVSNVSQNAFLVSATEEVYYDMQPVSTGGNTSPHNSYTAAATVTVTDSSRSVSVGWSVTGNSNMVPWRIGGKSISGVDRDVHTTTSVGEAITKIELVLGAASSITVNSIKLDVGSTESGTDIDTVNKNSGTLYDTTLTYQPSSGDSWAKDSYYKFTFNVTVSGSNNKFVALTEMKFYHDASHTHNWVAGTVHAPTCTEAGYTEYSCSTCGATKHDDEVAALGHDYGEWTVTTAPTCTEAGEKTRVCSRDSSHTETETIPATGHHYVDGICTECGAEEPLLGYLQILPTDGTATTEDDYTITKLPITVSVGKSTLTADEIRVFKGKTITISGIEIKKIEFTCTANGTAKYGPGCFLKLYI